jgi:hypothetical protein
VSSIYFCLKDPVDPNKLIEKIQRLLKKNTISANSILEISLKQVAYEDDLMTPKLEYKIIEEN